MLGIFQNGQTNSAVDFTVGDKVCVLPGRHFQDFAAGDSGVVSMVDRDAQTCQVYFDHRLGSEALSVAFRHLSWEGGSRKSTLQCAGSSQMRMEALEALEALEILGFESPKKLEPSEAHQELDVAPLLGNALGAVASAGYWEGALAHLGASPAPGPAGCDDGALASALEASAAAKAEASAAALLEASRAGLRLKDLDEKVVRHNREHWLGLECLQEKVGDLSSTQRALHEEFAASVKKDMSAFREHVADLSTKCQALADLVATIRTELGGKASHDQLEDLEHQQCKAFERFVARWEACAEARRRNLRDEMSSAIGEVRRPAVRTASEQAQLGSTPSGPSRQTESRRHDELQASMPSAGLEEVVRRVQAELTDLRRELTSLRTEAKQASQLKLEGLTEAREQRYQSLSATVESLKSSFEVIRRSTKESSDTREQALLEGLRLRADACAEGLASEVRIREEATQRLESLLQQTRRDLEAKLESVRGALEKQLRGTLNHKDKELQLELMGAMQLELQKRQDAETSLRDLQCEMVEIRSKLMRKEHALLEATGFKEPVGETRAWRPGLTGTLFAEPTPSREAAPSSSTGPSSQAGSPLNDPRATATPAVLRPMLQPRSHQWPT